MANFGVRLKSLRESVGLSQGELGELMGRSKQWVWLLENGDSAAVLRVDDLAPLAHLGFDAIGYVTGGKPDPLALPYDEVRQKIADRLAKQVTVE